MVDPRRIEALKKVAEAIREIEQLEREAADELATPRERRARFRVIRGGKALALVPFTWLAARARDHHAVAAAMGSTALAAGVIGTGLLVGANGDDGWAGSSPRPDVSPGWTSAAASPSSGSPNVQRGRQVAPDLALPEVGSAREPLLDVSPLPSALGIGVPELPPLPVVPLPSEPPLLVTVLPSPVSTALPTEAEALEYCLSLLPPPADVDECVRELLD